MSRTGSAVSELAKMIVAGGVSLDPLAKAPTIDDVRLLAKKRLPKMAFDFIDGGADAEITLRANVADFAQVTLRPRSLVDISAPSLTTTVAGETLPVPLLFAPCGLMRLAGGDGELSAVRAAGKAGLIYTISTASSWSIEEIAAEASGPLWFQLYLWRNREIVSTLVRRAEGGRLHGPGGHRRRADQRQTRPRPPQRHVDSADGHGAECGIGRPAPVLVPGADARPPDRLPETCRASPRDPARCPTRST